jgi:hypothetical protein
MVRNKRKKILHQRRLAIEFSSLPFDFLNLLKKKKKKKLFNFFI